MRKKTVTVWRYDDCHNAQPLRMCNRNVYNCIGTTFLTIKKYHNVLLRGKLLECIENYTTKQKMLSLVNGSFLYTLSIDAVLNYDF